MPSGGRRHQRPGLRVDTGDHRPLRGDPGPLSTGRKGYYLVSGPEPAAAWGVDLRARQLAEALPHGPSGAVERLHRVLVVGDEKDVSALDNVVGPGPDHLVYRLFAAPRRVDPALAGVPGDRGRQVATTQVVEGVAFGWVPLAEVVLERPNVARVSGD